MLNIKHLTKTYGSKKAVDDLSLHIAPGEIYGFIGLTAQAKQQRSKAASESFSLMQAKYL
jgi:ABC-2 type transport system ATP-binding protein